MIRQPPTTFKRKEKTMKTITVRTSYEGIHRYPGASDDVVFLRQPHRHTFGVCVELEVFHDDREIEFITLKRLIIDWLKGREDLKSHIWYMGTLSCEQVASGLMNHLFKTVDKLPNRYCKITIDEDGENGASIEKKATDVWLEDEGTVVPVPTILEDTESVEGRTEEHIPKYPITFSKYQRLSYSAIQEHESNQEEVMHWAIGLGEEAGEALSVVKHKYYGGSYSVEDMVAELGDVLWNVSALCTALGIDLQDVVSYNVAKLQHRYPDGEFDDKRSQARHNLAFDFKHTDECKLIMDHVNKTVLSRSCNLKEKSKNERFQSSTDCTSTSFASN